MAEFHDFMKRAGFNLKEVSLAGKAIGLNAGVAQRLSRGLRELEETERLAMSAYLAGLEPWTPEYAERLQKMVDKRRQLAESVIQVKQIVSEI